MTAIEVYELAVRMAVARARLQTLKKGKRQ